MTNKHTTTTCRRTSCQTVYGDLIPATGLARDVMKVTNVLAILVVAAMCLLVSGCENLFGGPQNCEFGVQGWGCAPNPDSVDGVSYGDGYSSPETTTTTTDSGAETTKQTNVCKKFLWLNDTKWYCHSGPVWENCILRTLVHTDGQCWVATTPLYWGAPAETLTFSTNGQLSVKNSIDATITCEYKS